MNSMSLHNLLIALLERTHAVRLFAQEGTGAVTEEAPGGATPMADSGGVLDGIYEVDFVLVSLAVGAIGILLVVHLMRRVTPPPKERP